MAYKFRADRTLSRAFKDFSIGFKANPNTEDFSVVKNENAIKQSIRNLVSTGMYERPFQPNTGSRLREMLFEPYDVFLGCLLYTSPSPRDRQKSRMPSSA